jgi:hypothetical protein
MLNATQSDPRIIPTAGPVRRKRAGTDELFEQPDHIRLAGNISIQKELTADDSKIPRIPKWRPALPLVRRRKDRFELFFEGRGHGQAFDDHDVQGGPGDRIQSHSRLFNFSDELRILQRFQKGRFHGAHRIAWHAWRYRITMRVATRARVEFL